MRRGRAAASGQRGVFIAGQGVPVSGQSALTASDFSPLSLTSLQAWYQADALALADGATVEAWPDSSGQGRTLARVDGAGGPCTFETNELNGLPVVRFQDGTGDTLRRDDAAFRVLTFSVFVVGKFRATPSARGLVSMFLENTAGWNISIINGANAFNSRIGSGGPPSDRAFGAWNTDWHVFGLTRDNGTTAASQYLDGVEAATFALAMTMGAAAVFSLARFYQNSGTQLVGPVDIAELVFCDAVLTDADRAALTDYLASKYGL